MRYAIMGSGGMGAMIGGLLARSSQDVTFIARGANLDALRTRGLTVKPWESESFQVAVRATDDPTTVGPVDLVWLCVKTYDVEPAAQLIRPLIGPETMVLPVQNGVDTADQIAAVVGSGPVLGGVSPYGATLEEPGVVAQKGRRLPIVFGELSGGRSPRVERLHRELLAAGLEAELSDDIRLALWAKLVSSAGFIGLTSLLRLPIGPIMACPESRELMRGVLTETEAVGLAAGFDGLRGTAEKLMAVMDGSPAGARGSMYFDLVGGRRLEIDDLNGAVVRFGARHGVATPLNFAVYAALKPHANGAQV